MAMEAADIKRIADDALKHKVAECIISCDDTALAQTSIVRKVIYRVPDEVIEQIMTDLFTQAIEEGVFENG